MHSIESIPKRTLLELQTWESQALDGVVEALQLPTSLSLRFTLLKLQIREDFGS
jgi:hypothetical protein